MPKPVMQNRGHSNEMQTPPEAILPLLPFIDKNWVVWECAPGRGSMVRALRTWDIDVIAEDTNFLLWEPKRYDCIITNPPYSIKDQFLKRAYQLGKPFAFLLPITALESERRQYLYRTYGLEIILFNKRINFETPSGRGSGSWFPTAWFTNWLNIGAQMTFVDFDSIPEQIF